MSPHPATRLNGVCLGSLWKQHSSAAAPPKIMEFSADGNERSKSHDYCMLLGHTLFTYPDIYAYNRGDHAMVYYLLDFLIYISRKFFYYFVALYDDNILVGNIMRLRRIWNDG